MNQEQNKRLKLLRETRVTVVVVAKYGGRREQKTVNSETAVNKRLKHN